MVFSASPGPPLHALSTEPHRKLLLRSPRSLPPLSGLFYSFLDRSSLAVFRLFRAGKSPKVTRSDAKCWFSPVFFSTGLGFSRPTTHA